MKRLKEYTIFNSDALHHNLSTKYARGGIIALSGQLVQFFISTAGTMILARLLMPKDYGLIGMVLVVFGFVEMFKDAGLSMATIQSSHITKGQVSLLFWLNVIISLVIFLSVILFAPVIASFYGHNELKLITIALSVSIIISGVTIQHQALMKRHMYFGELFLINIVSQAVALTVSIGMAIGGLGYWALVGGAIAKPMLATLMTFYFCPWVPGRMKIVAGAGKMLKFGGHLMGFRFVNYFARNLDNILVGKILGASELGYYSKAYQILMLPITLLSGPLSGVAVPVLSRYSDDNNQLQKYYLHTLYLLSVTSALIAGISYVSCREIVLIILGDNWIQVIPVFKLLAIGSLFQPLYNTQAWLHIAKGRADRVLKSGIVCSTLIVTSLVIGINYGINGVALFYSIAIIVSTVFSLSYAAISADIRLLKLFSVVWKPIFCCLVAVFFTEYISFSMSHSLKVFETLLLRSCLYVASYVVVLILMYNSIRPISDIFEIRKYLKNK